MELINKGRNLDQETNDWGTSIKRDFHDKVDACRKDLENTHFSNNAQDSGFRFEATNLTQLLNHQPRSPLIWSPPAAGFLKSNLDVVIFKEENAFGIKLCLCDAQGTFIKAY
ncbi:hypothetical protein JHK87_012075 [Glycine soja]|nr:hypothetical protein JHK87_012075 [Glycine soja]